MKVVAGLGNPGKRYEGTRHNVGFEVIDILARADHIQVAEKRFDSLIGEGEISGVRTLLVKPQTFVNNTGIAVRQVLDWWKRPVEDLLVVCDDANLPVGKLRFRREGSAGGHHGLESIISHLGTDGFQRLRVGIGRRDGEPLVGHVLGKFSKAERAIIDEICIDAARGATVWLVKGIEACMNRFNA